MKTPFFHKETLALHPSNGKVDWACLSTVFAKEKQVEMGTLQFDGGIRWADVATLIEEKGWADAQIVIRLDPLYVRYFLIQGPVLETVGEFDLWILTEVSSQLPTGAEINDFVFRSRVLSQDEESLRCLVGLVRKNSMEYELSMLHTAGIFPVRFSGLYSDLDLIARHDVAEMKYGYTLIVDDGESGFMSYQEGALIGINQFEGLKNEEDRLMWQQSLISSVIEHHPGPEHGQLLNTGNDIASHYLPTDELKALGISSSPWHLSLTGIQVEVKQFANCAMIEGMSPDIYEFNFLEEEHVQAQVNKLKKKLTMKAVLASGGMLACLLTLIIVLQIFFSSRLMESEENLILIGTQIHALDKQNKTIEQLKRKLQQARHFIGERTATAGILTQLGKCIPEDVWLDEFTVSNEKDHWNVLIKGAAVNEQDVAILLGRLEQLEVVSDVELVLSESVATGRHYKKDKLRSINVTRFDIVVRFSNTLNLSQQRNTEVS